MYDMVWRWTKRAQTTCLRSRISSVGDQCPQAAWIVNQGVAERGTLQTGDLQPQGWPKQLSGSVLQMRMKTLHAEGRLAVLTESG